MYRAYLRSPGEVRGHGILDTNSLSEIRQELEGMVFPEGAFVYIRYGRPDWGRPDKAIEAYRIEGGRLSRIYSRYKGGEWPKTWEPSDEDYREVREAVEEEVRKRMEEEDLSSEAQEDVHAFMTLASRGKIQRDVFSRSRERWAKDHSVDTHPRISEGIVPCDERRRRRRRNKFFPYYNILSDMGESESEIDDFLKEREDQLSDMDY